MDRKEVLKELDAIGFDELGDYLPWCVQECFRRSGDHKGKQVSKLIVFLPGGRYRNIISWMVSLLRVSVGRERDSGDE